jgi:hypothetical protein
MVVQPGNHPAILLDLAVRRPSFPHPLWPFGGRGNALSIRYEIVRQRSLSNCRNRNARHARWKHFRAHEKAAGPGSGRVAAPSRRQPCCLSITLLSGRDIAISLSSQHAHVRTRHAVVPTDDAHNPLSTVDGVRTAMPSRSSLPTDGLGGTASGCDYLTTSVLMILSARVCFLASQSGNRKPM